MQKKRGIPYGTPLYWATRFLNRPPRGHHVRLKVSSTTAIPNLLRVRSVPPSLLCPSSFHLPSPPLHVFVHHLSIMCAGGEEALGEGGESGEREGSKIPHKKGNMSRNRRTRRKRKEEEGIALYQPKGKKKRGRRRKEPSSPMAFFNERRYPPPPHLSSLSHFMTFYCLLPSPSPSLCPDTSD